MFINVKGSLYESEGKHAGVFLFIYFFFFRIKLKYQKEDYFEIISISIIAVTILQKRMEKIRK